MNASIKERRTKKPLLFRIWFRRRIVRRINRGRDTTASEAVNFRKYNGKPITVLAHLLTNRFGKARVF